MVARSEMDSNSCSGQLVGRCEIVVKFLARSGSLDCSLWLSLSKVGHFRTSHVSWVLCKLSDVEKGRSEVEDDHGSPCGETGYQGHELFGLDGASIRGCKDLHGSTSATPTLWRRVQTPPAKSPVQRGKRQGRISATIHDEKVGADRGSLRSRSGYHANNHLGAQC